MMLEKQGRWVYGSTVWTGPAKSLDGSNELWRPSSIMVLNQSKLGFSKQHRGRRLEEDVKHKHAHERTHAAPSSATSAPARG